MAKLKLSPTTGTKLSLAVPKGQTKVIDNDEDPEAVDTPIEDKLEKKVRNKLKLNKRKLV